MDSTEDPHGGRRSSRDVVNDERLVLRLEEKLLEADLQTTTVRDIRKQLEEEFGVVLSDRKALIRETVDKFLDQTLPSHIEEDERDGVQGMGIETGNATIDADEPGSKSSAGGFGSLLSPQMAAFVGQAEMPRTQVVKFLWNYIKKNDLQDPKDRRKIMLDENLKTLFKPPLNMLNMNKKLSKHVFQQERLSERPPSKARIKTTKNKSASDATKATKGIKSIVKTLKIKEKKPRNHPLFLMSPELQAFFNNETREMSRPLVVKHMWDYIRENNLQDPKDRRQILLDAKLETIFEAPVNMFTMNKQLSRHLTSLSK